MTEQDEPIVGRYETSGYGINRQDRLFHAYMHVLHCYYFHPVIVITRSSRVIHAFEEMTFTSNLE